MKSNVSMDFKDLFLNEEYDTCISSFHELMKEEKEDLESCYYALLSLIGNNDLYQALSIIKKSKILNSELIKSYLDSEGANLINLLNENDEIKKVVIVINFISNHKEDDMADPNACMDYFEMIGSLYELGYASGIVKELTSIGHMLFKM